MLCNLHAEETTEKQASETENLSTQMDARGQFIANAYWQSIYASRLAQLTARSYSQTLKDEFYFDIEAGLLGLCLCQKNLEGQNGFHMDSTGLYTGLYIGRPSKYKFGLVVASQLANAKEKQGHNESETQYLSLSSHLEGHGFDGRLIVVNRNTLTVGVTDFNSTQQGLLGACYGSFNGGSAISSLYFYFPIKAKTNDRLTIMPFIGYVMSVAQQNGFEEEGVRPRVYETGDAVLSDLSLPFGIYNKLAFRGCCPSLWEIEVSYKPTIARKDPSIGTLFVADKKYWVSQPTSVCHHNASLHLKNETQLLKFFHINLDYQCDFSSTTRSHYILGGAKLSF
ncbi:autotransporter outer membrane beta-barrel domain-containing protein [Chlamydia vaughanii]|uniref:autotransporter outer membrane beta-barrel domain-containing protein n=1 Tax=Chlamydia vaughanii TaxID=3112552 RepID=UPI0032B1AF24